MSPGSSAVLASGMTVSAFGRTRIGPDNWTFLTDLWEQIAFWAHSLVFLLASILIPKLLFDVRLHDLILLAVLIVAAFRRQARGPVPPAPDAQSRAAHQADQHRLQARDRLGRADAAP